MMAPLTLLSTLLALSSSLCPAEDSVEAALYNNDECELPGEGCAVNALQLKANQNASDGDWAAELLQELGGSLDAAETQADAAQVCYGNGRLPPNTICYGGSFLTEVFFVKLRHGKVSMWAKGLKDMKCLHQRFHQTGQSIQIPGLSACDLGDVQYSAQYCSFQDQVLVNLIKPMSVSVTLNRKHC
eukprot:TRINITY_DN80065_c0_g1_i1.p1 TRINITY_DN80065_c0_g1~~TRINITY_DN80065_c0_g1_i1.p1  ORF type:complete len:203 (+),score=42.25 TRINITY_DN80065_c0_g1_i1:53-610(+)